MYIPPPPQGVAEGSGLPHECATWTTLFTSISSFARVVFHKCSHKHEASALLISSQHCCEGFIWGPDFCTYMPHWVMRSPMPGHSPTTTSPQNTTTPIMPRITRYLLSIILPIFLQFFSSAMEDFLLGWVGIGIGGAFILLCEVKKNWETQRRTHLD